MHLAAGVKQIQNASYLGFCVLNTGESPRDTEATWAFPSVLEVFGGQDCYKTPSFNLHAARQ